jgi:DNA-directed RNA polymerase III subunit RPC11
VCTNVRICVAKCPMEKCDSREAFFRQIQTRSADEPMTNLYRCVKCMHEWREG